MKAVRNMVRRLIPRMPQRDRGVDQDCTFLVADAHSMEHEDGAEDVSLVILSPRIEIDPEDGKEITLPWYHPRVRHLAFRYTTNDSGEASLRIEIIPLDSAAGTSIGLTDNGGVDTTSRLYRTCVSLLETIFKYGRGKMTGYKKRVIHDTLVPREEYQDLYLIMREKFKSIADTWHEATDASKHVFEDISIATFLMLLWKYTYPASPYTSSTSSNPHEPWYSWGRPPEGFLDLGCGNGLLVHILIECGYEGLGVDLRARKSWPHYPSTTRDRLFVHAFNPTISCLRVPIPPASTDSHHKKDDHTDGPDTIERDMFPKTKSGKGRFIIGNHADELQPWVPLLAALTSAEYLSIPCCTWEFDKRFQLKKRHGGGTKGQKTEANDEGDGADPDALNEGADSSSAVRPPEEVELERKLRFDEKDGKMSLYASYVLWLATLSEECGFVIETEALRIPSTKNRAIIGRKQKANADVGAIKASIKARVEYIRARGLFKIRKPEGDAGLEIEDRNSGQPKKSPDRLHSLKYGELNANAPTIGEFRLGDLAWGPVQSVAPKLGCGPRLPITTKTSKPVRASRLSTSHSVA
ncbi:uncharacterized protein EI90DRAFT_3085214, partial [Cantharellus anzutake]|uniref:uncharacterized protein n=1 Tax=Cantharellus anzutake TaxID=1750568 RepID=UPI0019089A23